MGSKTVLYDKHLESGARIVDFGGWDMPLHYGSQKQEHHAVRRHAGVFDVSHMTIVDLAGAKTRELLTYLLANDVNKLSEPGQALYSCMLNESGGVIDDLIVYFLGSGDYRLIVNAGTHDKDLAWIHRQALAFDVAVDERQELAMLAVQGPAARELAAACIPADLREAAMALRPFHGVGSGDWYVARTGYTGEDGWEIVLPQAVAANTWDELLAAGVTPCGLGARDTLRLEAAMNLYGNDMDESVTPLESGLAWTVAFEPKDRDFIGRAALEKRRNDPSRRRFVGLVLDGGGVLRGHQAVHLDDGGIGEITSGGFSPTLDRSVALARIPAGSQPLAKVDVRGRLLDVRIVKTPFVRHGKILLDA